VGNGSAEREAKLIGLLIDIRAQARKNKDFATSDQIRDQLAAAGVVLEDRPDGTVWRVN
jgi:cysteinyl-tRNA synthetase